MIDTRRGVKSKRCFSPPTRNWPLWGNPASSHQKVSAFTLFRRRGTPWRKPNTDEKLLCETNCWDWNGWSSWRTSLNERWRSSLLSIRFAPSSLLMGLLVYRDCWEMAISKKWYKYCPTRATAATWRRWKRPWRNTRPFAPIFYPEYVWEIKSFEFTLRHAHGCLYVKSVERAVPSPDDHGRRIGEGKLPRQRSN